MQIEQVQVQQHFRISINDSVFELMNAFLSSSYNRVYRIIIFIDDLICLLAMANKLAKNRTRGTDANGICANRFCPSAASAETQLPPLTTAQSYFCSWQTKTETNMVYEFELLSCSAHV